MHMPCKLDTVLSMLEVQACTPIYPAVVQLGVLVPGGVTAGYAEQAACYRSFLLVGRMDVDLVQQQLDLLGCVLRNGGRIMAPCH